MTKRASLGAFMAAVLVAATVLSSAPPTSAQPPQRPQIDTATLRGHVSPPLEDYIGCPPSRCEDGFVGARVTLSFDRDINADAIPPASAFVLRTVGTTRSAEASAVSVAGSTVTVTFARINSDDSPNRVSQLFRVGSTIVLDYTMPTEASQQLKGTNGEAVSGFTNQTLTTVPLTAAWSGTPSNWTGQPFSVTLTLSEPMSSAYPPSAGWSIDPDQGDTWAQISVEDADGTQSQFTVTVTPRRNVVDTLLNEGDITLTARPKLCYFESSICTVDLRRLSGSATATIPFSRTSTQTEQPREDDPTLTAAFEELPGAHNGLSFTFRAQFSEAIKISYRRMVDSAFTVTDGTITRARRVDRRNDLWEMTVAPANASASVVISLSADRPCDERGAVCTSDGTRLTNAVAVTIAP